MTIFDEMAPDDFEQVIFSQDKRSGLKAITVLHDTTLGPAIGGIRYYPYATEGEALKDAMRLAKGMTYKNAAAGLPHGGGKTVFMKDPDATINEEAMFRAFGRIVEGMNGRYIPSVDVGTSSDQMDFIALETDYVVGSYRRPGASGNPSPTTGYGVFSGIKAAVQKVFGTDSLEGRTILLEGAGKVGLTVAEYALAEGARVIATDISEESLLRAKELGCEVVEPSKLFDVEADIYSPCALGGTVNEEMIEKLKGANVKIVAGAANNQLETDQDGERLKDAGILYVPDYILNAGGVIHVADELNGGFNYERTMKAVKNISNQIQRVFELAEANDLPMNKAADQFAEDRIEAVLQTKRIYRGK